MCAGVMYVDEMGSDHAGECKSAPIMELSESCAMPCCTHLQARSIHITFRSTA